VPLLVAGGSVRPVDLGTRTTFGDLGATVAEFLGHAGAAQSGTSFLPALQGTG
jgi:phosphopentomutase